MLSHAIDKSWHPTDAGRERALRIVCHLQDPNIGLSNEINSQGSVVPRLETWLESIGPAMQDTCKIPWQYEENTAWSCLICSKIVQTWTLSNDFVVVGIDGVCVANNW